MNWVPWAALGAGVIVGVWLLCWFYLDDDEDLD
jgi:hypothetical protein